MARKYICFPKNEGALDVVNLSNWDKAAVMRCFRYLFVKASSLWLAWVNKFFPFLSRVLGVGGKSFN